MPPPWCRWSLPLPAARLFGCDDHIRGLDHGGDLAALGQAKLLDCLDGNRGDESLAGDVEHHVGDRLAPADLGHGSAKLISRAELHCGSPLSFVRPSM